MVEQIDRIVMDDAKVDRRVGRQDKQSHAPWDQQRTIMPLRAAGQAIGGNDWGGKGKRKGKTRQRASEAC
jgi:hypothetical protein